MYDKKKKETGVVERVSRRYSRLIREMKEDFGGNLAGGAWNLEGEAQSKDELLEMLKSLERFISASGYSWKGKGGCSYRRVYDDEGKMDYALTEDLENEKILEELLKDEEELREG